VEARTRRRRGRERPVRGPGAPVVTMCPRSASAAPSTDSGKPLLARGVERIRA
jgi:hypothetical protein